MFLAAAGRKMQLTFRVQRIWHANLRGFVVVTVGKHFPVKGLGPGSYFSVAGLRPLGGLGG